MRKSNKSAVYLDESSHFSSKTLTALAIWVGSEEGGYCIHEHIWGEDNPIDGHYLINTTDRGAEFDDTSVIGIAHSLGELPGKIRDCAIQRAKRYADGNLIDNPNRTEESQLAKKTADDDWSIPARPYPTLAGDNIPR